MLLFIALCVATYTDYREYRIPVWLFPSTLILYLLMSKPDANHVWGMIIGLPILFLCLSGLMGGGDLLMFVTVGYVIGIKGILGLAYLMALIGNLFFLVNGKKDTLIPIAPFVTVSYFLYQVIASVL